MLKILMSFIIAGVLLMPIGVLAEPFAQTELQEPEYAKWGRLALAETKAKYNSASIVDYLHIGRRQISPTVSEERFKFWLRNNEREFGVYVWITFETATDKVISIRFQETNR